jgi:hypothetical protein
MLEGKTRFEFNIESRSHLNFILDNGTLVLPQIIPSQFIFMSSEVAMALLAASYHPRRPQDSDYYHCVEDYFLHSA